MNILLLPQAFLEGFWQLIPRDLISIFNDHELELLISGLPDIDVADLRANTEYTGYTAASPVIQWFWQVVAEMDKQDLALLLQFVTGMLSFCDKECDLSDWVQIKMLLALRAMPTTVTHSVDFGLTLNSIACIVGCCWCMCSCRQASDATFVLLGLFSGTQLAILGLVMTCRY